MCGFETWVKFISSCFDRNWQHGKEMCGFGNQTAPSRLEIYYNDPQNHKAFHVQARDKRTIDVHYSIHATPLKNG